MMRLLILAVSLLPLSLSSLPLSPAAGERDEGDGPLASAARDNAPRRIKLLFLGDHGHHQPAERFRQLGPVLAKRGIDLTYTDKVTVLNPNALLGYDGLVIYANIEKITPEQEKALLK